MSTIDYAPGLLDFVERVNAAMPPDFYTRPLAEQRQLYEDLATVFPYPTPASVHLSEHAFETAARTLRLRLYEPRLVRRNGLVFYIRGGGFVVGSLDTHHSVAAEMAALSQLRVVAVDFPMAPEHPFPEALQTILHIYRALTDGAWDLGVPIDPDDVTAVGDSSGGNMAVTLAMMCRDHGIHGPAALGLISPVLDFTRWRQGGEDVPLLTGGEMEYYTACYCPDPADVTDPYVSPLLSGRFDGLPPTLVMGGSLDSLRVDGDQLCERLRAHNIPAIHSVHTGLVHSAIRARAHSPAVAAAWTDFCQRLASIAVHEGVLE